MSYTEFLRKYYNNLQNDNERVDPNEILIANGTITEERALSLAAEFYNTKVIDLGAEPCLKELFTPDIFELCTRNSIAPWRVHDGIITYAVWRNPSHKSVKKFVYASKHSIIQTICEQYKDKMYDLAANKNIFVDNYNVSAYFFDRKNAAKMFWALITCAIAWPIVFINSWYLIFLVTATSSLLFKLYLNYSSLKRKTPLIVNSDINEKLPEYTILLPLYKEKAVVKQLINAIRNLDYPLWLLDIKILLESDDHETIALIKEMNLPRMFELLILPDLPPRTKAKACNYALLLARGKYITTYDAEDIPDPDQLNKAASVFSANKNIVCLQSRLEIYNENTNLLTKMFAIEYKIWHLISIKGMCNASLPAPLCGSSNHLRVNFLRAIGGWDAYNVTEDAELGMRIYAYGKRISQLDSRTLEEAPASAGTWLKQRARWTKGFVITNASYIRHMRMLISKFGFRGTMCLMLLLFFMQFASQITSVIMIVLISFLNIPHLRIMCLATLLLNIIVHSIQLITLRDIKNLPLAPIYLIYIYFMHQIATLVSYRKLITDPYKWEKTIHTETKKNP